MEIVLKVSEGCGTVWVSGVSTPGNQTLCGVNLHTLQSLRGWVAGMRERQEESGEHQGETHRTQEQMGFLLISRGKTVSRWRGRDVNITNLQPAHLSALLSEHSPCL